MPPKPKPQLQVGSPRAQKRTVLDDATFKDLSARAEVTELDAAVAPTPTGRRSKAKPVQRTGKPPGPANRKGRSGDPYVRKGDGVATVPQYLTLPADLAKRLKIYAIEHDAKVSHVAAAALAEYLERH